MFEKVCEILADKFDADASTMTMDTKVKEDLERRLSGRCRADDGPRGELRRNDFRRGSC